MKQDSAAWKFGTQNLVVTCDFKAKFGALFKVHFGYAIYCFEAWEVRSPTL